MTVVVTGGAGFIGSNFIFYLHKAHPDYRIICLDKLTYAADASALEAMKALPNFRFVRADICDASALDALFAAEAPDMVINFAAESHVDRSIEQPALFLQTNVLGVGILMDACRKHGVGRFHQISTDEVYGDLPLDCPELLFTEQSPLRPGSPYSASKASADLLVLAYHRTYGLPASISRCSNNYGPYQHSEKLIPKMIARALKEQPLSVYGDGRNVRDWIYVSDHCRAVDLIVHRGRVGEIYNVGSSCELSNFALIRQICAALGKSPQLITFAPDRPGHDLRYGIDASKLKNELGWRPEIPFEQGFAATLQWYKEKEGRSRKL